MGRELLLTLHTTLMNMTKISFGLQYIFNYQRQEAKLNKRI